MAFPSLGGARMNWRNFLFASRDALAGCALGLPHADSPASGQSRGVRLLDASKLFWPEERPDVIAQEAQRPSNAWVPSNKAVPR
jgi:hypothetical protein